MSYLWLYREEQTQEDKANTCDKKIGVKSGRCQAALVLSFMKKQGHLKQPDAHEMLFLDTTSELTWREV